MSLICPLCGKTKAEEHLFCPDCTDKLDSEYELNVPALEDSGADAMVDDEAVLSETPEDIIEENIEEAPEEQKSQETLIAVPEPLYDKKAWKRKKEDRRSASSKSYYEITRDKKTNKITFITASIVIVALALLVSLFFYNKHVRLGNLERSKWEVAQRENTVDSYLMYMDEYPQGAYSKEAYTKMLSLKNDENLLWQNLTTSENTSEFIDFLERYPNSPYQRMVRNRFDSLIWQSSLKENSLQSYSDYINRSTQREISGEYMGEAQKRLKMLQQVTPVDEVDMVMIKETVSGFFIGLSNVSHAELSVFLAPKIVRFNQTMNLQNEEMVGLLLLLASKANATSLRFDPEITQIQYEKMGNDTYNVNVPLQKILEDNNGDTDQIKGYIVHLKLDPNYRIFSYFETKPFSTAP